MLKIKSKFIKCLVLGMTIGVLTLALCPFAVAEDLPKQSVLPLAMAQKAAQAAVAKCERDGFQVSVAVVDRGGHLKALLRADGAGPHTQDSSFKKAYTSASLKMPTGFFGDLLVKKPELRALRDMNANILMLGGGFPVQIDGEVVGGIGVGGAPGAHFDEACAMAGLEAIGAVPKKIGEKSTGEKSTGEKSTGEKSK